MLLVIYILKIYYCTFLLFFVCLCQLTYLQEVPSKKGGMKHQMLKNNQIDKHFARAIYRTSWKVCFTCTGTQNNERQQINNCGLITSWKPA